MSPVQPGSDQSDAADAEAIRAWLEALANGSYDGAAFLEAVRHRFKSNPEASWEVLSHLDQYYRRGRIAPETFKNIKSALAETALGLPNRAPPAHIRPPPAKAVLEPEETLQIPLARDIVMPPRVENTDRHPRREETQTLDAIGEPKPGSVLRRRYRLETLIGQGGTGPVFQAVDEYRLESPGSQRVAVKILHPAVVRRAELLAELRREFQVLQLLSHPNILRVFEFDRDAQLVFFTMELLNGATLSRVLQARKLAPLPLAQALAAVRDIGAALAYAHSRGAVHGDLSPRNIFVTAQGELRLRGFPGANAARPASPGSDHESTLPVAMSGYASCQILEGARADVRDDIFSLACLAYLLITGEHPLGNKTATEARDSRLLVQRPARMGNRQWRALRAALRWDRDDRPPDMQQWLIDLDLRGAAARLPSLSDLLEAPPGKEDKPRWAAKAAIAAAVILAGAYWYVSQRGMLPSIKSVVATAPSEPSASPPIPESTPPSPPPPALASVPVTTAPVAMPRATSPPSAAPPAAAPPAAAPPVVASSRSAPPAVAPPVSMSAAPAAQVPAAEARSTKVELASDTVDVPTGEPAALIPVHRRGSLRGETTFTWWTESGTAKPGADFSAIMPQIAHIPDGKANLILSIPLSNTPHTQAKSFYVVIDQTEGGATLGTRTLTMITLQPPE